VLPITATAATGDNPAYLTGQIYDIVNEMGVGGATVELWYLRTTIISEDRSDPDRYLREWILIDTCTSESRGFWMVDFLAARPGIYRLRFMAPENALLPDGQAVTYTADSTYTWSADVGDERLGPLMFENPLLGPAMCEAYLYNPIDFNIPGLWWRWPNGANMIVNYVADKTLTPDDPCGYVETMYIHGLVYDPTLAGDIRWPDSKEDGISNVDVQLWRAWVGHGALSPWIGPVIGVPELIRQKSTNEGHYFIDLAPTDTPGVEQYAYWLVINGVGSPVFDGVACPQADLKHVEANFNWPQGTFDALRVQP